MAALDYLLRAGLTVVTVADKLRVTPAERITPDLRQHIITHKAELLAELNPTHDQADEMGSKADCHILTAATASPDWRQARDRYIDHLMACHACHAPAGRYCAAGRDVRQQYKITSMEKTP